MEFTLQSVSCSHLLRDDKRPMLVGRLPVSSFSEKSIASETGRPGGHELVIVAAVNILREVLKLTQVDQIDNFIRN